MGDQLPREGRREAHNVVNRLEMSTRIDAHIVGSIEITTHLSARVQQWPRPAFQGQAAGLAPCGRGWKREATTRGSLLGSGALVLTAPVTTCHLWSHARLCSLVPGWE